MKQIDDLLANPVATILIVLFLMGLAGTDDYTNAKMAEKTLCERGATKPEWCAEIKKGEAK